MFTIFVPRIVGRQFRVRNSVSGLSGSNFVYKILSADCREAILCAKFRQRIVGRQFRVQNSVSGSSGGNFVCKICSLAFSRAIFYVFLLLLRKKSWEFNEGANVCRKVFAGVTKVHFILVRIDVSSMESDTFRSRPVVFLELYCFAPHLRKGQLSQYTIPIVSPPCCLAGDILTKA